MKWPLGQGRRLPDVVEQGGDPHEARAGRRARRRRAACDRARRPGWASLAAHRAGPRPRAARPAGCPSSSISRRRHGRRVAAPGCGAARRGSARRTRWRRSARSVAQGCPRSADRSAGRVAPAKRTARMMRSASSANRAAGSPTARRIARSEVRAPAVRIDDEAAAGGEVDRLPGDRVDREVAPPEVLGERRAEAHVVRPPPIAVRSLRAKGRHLDQRRAGHGRSPFRSGSASAPRERAPQRPRAPRTWRRPSRRRSRQGHGADRGARRRRSPPRARRRAARRAPAEPRRAGRQGEGRARPGPLDIGRGGQLRAGSPRNR